MTSEIENAFNALKQQTDAAMRAKDMEISDLKQAIKLVTKYVSHLAQKPDSIEGFRIRMAAVSWDFNTAHGRASEIFEETKLDSDLGWIVTKAWDDILSGTKTEHTPESLQP